MRSLQDEIRQAQQELTCPICGRTFELRDIHLRSFGKSNSFEISVTCSRGHFPVILLVPITLKEASRVGKITKAEMKQVFSEIDDLTDSLQQNTK
ncbi:hypothetical protein A3A71_02930 [Candidatus Berkelbacteria bacterium RIFCSPLOWO2_01_FULL_50_28]|uniref:Uncharacterized protein n=1 Tax=Candidatus Berkelbacteria bacterium RIFCSPLOWO2_01_FULL_50_28 TaxID=1797471 RepID=A0A1F5EC77_9BACT|nr:MAG: hypothetical protein A2807_02465 [Candidatus Berkelbacteria bacterium RIFCSPHIGHO2_01_FULL_50_36]OGD62664.1 MAG: hypothetical protein A3F39_00480 [Candidatus Berkelbacteria bacterium RIFCSPHIGHO2_12_FULL_50_11]OGD64973.1 MAG: hypothetical protein A3A71_02930 [Candidatus Berkelbacteria bacterium RIFCSPLOWO2_01_FULL_50_28]